MKKIELELILEHADDALWGRVTYNDNLITESASSVAELEEKIKVLLHDFEDLDPEQVEFTHHYDVQALFSDFDWLNISKVASHAGINQALLRHYASGVKHPSLKTVQKIEATIHQLAERMNKAVMYAK